MIQTPVALLKDLDELEMKNESQIAPEEYSLRRLLTGVDLKEKSVDELGEMLEEIEREKLA